MCKFKITMGYLVFAVFVNSTVSFANQTFDDLYIPEINRSVGIQKNMTTKEFAVDFSELKNVRFRQSGTFDKALCTEWRKAVQIADPDLDLSFYQRSKLQLSLQLFGASPSTITRLIGGDWQNVSDLSIPKITLQPQWEGQAMTLLASEKVKISALKEIEEKINSVEGRKLLAQSGVLNFMVTNSLLACDLMQDDVSFSIQAEAFQSTGFHTLSTFKAADLVVISQKLQSASSILKPENNSVLTSDSLTAINAAGLLGFQMQQQGYKANVFGNGEFLKIFQALFPNGASTPVKLSESEATKTVNSMTNLKYESSEFYISEKLPLMKE